MITTTHTCEPSMQLQRFLFDQLWDQGVRHMFGIPGDFVLNLYEPLEADRRFQLIRLSPDPGSDLRPTALPASRTDWRFAASPMARADSI